MLVSCKRKGQCLNNRYLDCSSKAAVMLRERRHRMLDGAERYASLTSNRIIRLYTVSQKHTTLVLGKTLATRTGSI